MTGPARGAPARDLPTAPCSHFEESDYAGIGGNRCVTCGCLRAEHEGRVKPALAVPSRLPKPEEMAAQAYPAPQGARGMDRRPAFADGARARDALLLARLDAIEALMQDDDHGAALDRANVALDALRDELRGAS